MTLHDLHDHRPDQPVASAQFTQELRTRLLAAHSARSSTPVRRRSLWAFAFALPVAALALVVFVRTSSPLTSSEFLQRAEAAVQSPLDLRGLQYTKKIMTFNLYDVLVDETGETTEVVPRPGKPETYELWMGVVDRQPIILDRKTSATGALLRNGLQVFPVDDQEWIVPEREYMLLTEEEQAQTLFCVQGFGMMTEEDREWFDKAQESFDARREEFDLFAELATGELPKQIRALAELEKRGLVKEMVSPDPALEHLRTFRAEVRYDIQDENGLREDTLSGYRFYSFDPATSRLDTEDEYSLDEKGALTLFMRTVYLEQRSIDEDEAREIVEAARSQMVDVWSLIPVSRESLEKTPELTSCYLDGKFLTHDTFEVSDQFGPDFYERIRMLQIDKTGRASSASTSSLSASSSL